MTRYDGDGDVVMECPDGCTCDECHNCYECDDDDCSICCEELVIAPMPDTSKMTPEELEAYERQFKTCGYCQSIGRSCDAYTGHTILECRVLANTRCNYCAYYGHTGRHCPDRKDEDGPLKIKCMFCFRGGMDEKYYMSHTPDGCRFKREYEWAKRTGNPVPPRPRATQPRHKPKEPTLEEALAKLVADLEKETANPQGEDYLDWCERIGHRMIDEERRLLGHIPTEDMPFDKWNEYSNRIREAVERGDSHELTPEMFPVVKVDPLVERLKQLSLQSKQAVSKLR